MVGSCAPLLPSFNLPRRSVFLRIFFDRKLSDWKSEEELSDLSPFPFSFYFKLFVKLVRFWILFFPQFSSQTRQKETNHGFIGYPCIRLHDSGVIKTERERKKAFFPLSPCYCNEWRSSSSGITGCPLVSWPWPCFLLGSGLKKWLNGHRWSSDRSSTGTNFSVKK